MIQFHNADIINRSTPQYIQGSKWDDRCEEMVREAISNSVIGDMIRKGATVTAISSSPAQHDFHCPNQYINASFNVERDMDHIVQACRYNVRFVTVYSQK